MPKKQTLLLISGIPVHVGFGNGRRIRLSVSPHSGDVLVSAPSWVDDRQLTEFVVSRLDWIKYHRAKMIRLPKDSVLVWGRCVRQETKITSGPTDVELIDDTLVVRAPDESAAENAIAKWRRRDLMLALNPLLEKWQSQLGVVVNTVTLRAMTTRWGTCNHRTGRVTFSTLLTQKKPTLLEYVVVHELAHLVVPNHGPEFKAIMNRHLPKWRELRSTLNSPDPA